MRIEYTTKIEIDEAVPELSPADQERMLRAFEAAIEREIMKAFGAPSAPPAVATILPGNVITIDTIRPRPVRSSLGFLNYSPTT